MNFKTALLAFILVAVAPSLAFSQAKPTTSEPIAEQLQDAQIQLAVKDFQLAQITAQQAATNAQTAREKVMETVNSVKAARHLDDTWEYNFQAMKFEKKPATSKTPAAKK